MYLILLLFLLYPAWGFFFGFLWNFKELYVYFLQFYLKVGIYYMLFYCSFFLFQSVFLSGQVNLVLSLDHFSYSFTFYSLCQHAWLCFAMLTSVVYRMFYWSNSTYEAHCDTIFIPLNMISRCEVFTWMVPTILCYFFMVRSAHICSEAKLCLRWLLLSLKGNAIMYKHMFLWQDNVTLWLYNLSYKCSFLPLYRQLLHVGMSYE